MRLLHVILLKILCCLQVYAGSIAGVVPLPDSDESSIPIGKYRGKISGKVASAAPITAAVWLESSTLRAPAKPSTVTLEQASYQFKERLIIIAKGTTVIFPNKDSKFHNIYSLSKTKRFDLGRYKQDDFPAPQVTFDQQGLVELRCEIHDHMEANIIVVDSPYYTTTDENGYFKLHNVPAGNYTLHAQIDKKTSWKLSIKVTSEKNTQIQFPTP
ncbi:MAG: carboxypeptidase regulatory-like domain-containing protein [Akkermansiaceae bacterium]